MEKQSSYYEYKQLRQEVIERVKILHGLITLATILASLFLIGWMWLVNEKTAPLYLAMYVLFIPIIFSGLTFNYQANQMTLEAVAQYSQKIIENDHQDNWDKTYGRHKTIYRLTSFLKVLPLLLPQSLPWIVLIVNRALPTNDFLVGLWWIDLILFVLVVYNFRYKWA